MTRLEHIEKCIKQDDLNFDDGAPWAGGYEDDLRFMSDMLRRAEAIIDEMWGYADGEQQTRIEAWLSQLREEETK